MKIGSAYGRALLYTYVIFSWIQIGRFFSWSKKRSCPNLYLRHSGRCLFLVMVKRRKLNYVRMLFLFLELIQNYLTLSRARMEPTNEPPRDKTNKMACAPSEDSDQPGLPLSLIRVFAVRMKKAWLLSYPLSAQRGL